MRYYAFFISTDDQTIRFKKPAAINISINPKVFTIHGHKKIPVTSITSLTVQHDVSDKELSAGKALGGAVLAGGVGLAVGAAMGGKKVKSVLTTIYTNENNQNCTTVIESSNAYKVKEAYDKYVANHTAPLVSQPQIKTASKSFRHWTTIYLTWPYQLFKKLTSR